MDSAETNLQLYKQRRRSLLEGVTYIEGLSPGSKYILIKNLQKIGKIVSVSGSSDEDSFGMGEADVGISINSAYAMLRLSSNLLLKDITYVVDAMQFGRNIHDNMRKFLVYQLTTGVNLTFYILIGTMLYIRSPISPSTILWVNFLMDTLAGTVFGQELPDRSSTRITAASEGQQQYTSILDTSPPFDPKNDVIFNN